MKIEANQLLDDLITRTKANMEAIRPFEGLSDKELNWRSSQESWSILECIEHLNMYGDFYIPEIIRRINEATKADSGTVFKSGWLGNYFAESMLPKDKLNKMKTFKDKNPMGSKLSREVLKRFIEQQKELINLLNAARKVNLSKVKTSISISKLIKLRLGDTLRVVIYHNQRHLVQANKVLSLMSQPTERKSKVTN